MYPLKQSTAITVPFFAHDVNGDGVLAIADGSFTKRISKNGGAFAAMTVTVTELENGWYSLPVSTVHSDTNGVLTISLSAAGAKRVNLQFRVATRIDDDLAYPTVSGRSIDVDATGGVEITVNQSVNVAQWLGSAPSALIAGRVDANAQVVGDKTGYALTSGEEDAIVNKVWEETTAEARTAGTYGQLFKDNVNATISSRASQASLDTVQSDTDNIQTRLPAALVSGRMDSNAQVVADKTGYTLSAAGVTASRSVASGTAQSGSTTTLVDTARTEADTDYWRGSTLLITSGTIAGESRIISAFNPATDTITVDRAFTLAVGTNTYEILPRGPALLASLAHTGATVPTVTDVTNGVAVASIAANAITATSIASDAITAAKVANGAIDAATFAAGAIDAAAIATGAITSTKFAAGAIDAAAIATNAIDADAMADGAITALTFAAGAIDAAAIATDAITASKIANAAIDAATFAAGAIDAAALAAGGVDKISDGLLDRNMATGTDSGSSTVRTVRQALRMSRNRFNIAAGTLTVYKEDDATASWTGVVSTTAGNPISQVDPAS